MLEQLEIAIRTDDVFISNTHNVTGRCKEYYHDKAGLGTKTLHAKTGSVWYIAPDYHCFIDV